MVDRNRPQLSIITATFKWLTTPNSLEYTTGTCETQHQKTMTEHCGC